MRTLGDKATALKMSAGRSPKWWRKFHRRGKTPPIVVPPERIKLYLSAHQRARLAA